MGSRRAQHREIEEVALHHAALVEADLATQRQAQAHHRATLHLGADALGVDLRAAVDGHVHRHHLQLTLGVYRHLDHRGGVAHEAVGHRQAQAVSLGQLAAPAGALGCGFDHIAHAAGVDRVALGRLAVVPVVRQRARVQLARRADEVEQVLLVIASGFVGQLGHEALHGEGVRDVRDRAEPADAGVRLDLGAFQPQVGDVVGHVDGGHARFQVHLALAAFHEQRQDGRRGGAVQPGGGAPLGVDHGFQTFDGDRVQVVVLEVVLAGPDQFDGRALHLFGHHGGLGHVVGLGLATEAPADQQGVDLHGLGLEAQLRGDTVERGLRVLHRGPDLAATVLDQGGGHGRLHRGVGQMGQVVLGRDLVGRLGLRQRLHHVALVAQHLGGAAATCNCAGSVMPFLAATISARMDRAISAGVLLPM